MSKKYLFALLAFIIGSTTVMAEVQSPIYTDDIGRSHFLGRGGYSSVRQLQMGEAQAGFVNDAVDKYSNIKTETAKKAEDVKKDVEETKKCLDTVHSAYMTAIDNVNAELKTNFGYWAGYKVNQAGRKTTTETISSS